MEFVKWAAIALVAFFVFSWLRNGSGLSASTTLQSSGQQWGGPSYGGLYGRYQTPQAYAYGGNVPIYAGQYGGWGGSSNSFSGGYDPNDGGFNFGWSNQAGY